MILISWGVTVSDFILHWCVLSKNSTEIEKTQREQRVEQKHRRMHLHIYVTWFSPHRLSVELILWAIAIAKAFKLE